MSDTSSPVKRPRLSLQIKAISQDQTGRASRTLAATVDPKSPTSFNTLSNVYVTAISKSTPIQAEPLTAINVRSTKPRLQLQTKCENAKVAHMATPFIGHFPETPLTAQPLSPGVAMEMTPQITMTATPPLSAGPMEPPPLPKIITDTISFPSASASMAGDRTPRRRTTFPTTGPMARLAPYSHPRSLHSILRNSPLPPNSARTPITPRRQSLRLAERAARRVGYNSPLEQEITTHHYTRSHIDLLQGDMSPFSPADMPDDADMTPATALAYDSFESFEIRDGGQTPGPFEEMRRRMAGLETSTPVTAAAPSTPATGGVRKRKKKEKKRQWVWTIGEDNDEDSGGSAGGFAPGKAAQIAAVMQNVPTPARRSLVGLSEGIKPVQTRFQPQSTDIEPPTPSIESSSGLDSVFEDRMDDVAMSDTTSVASDVGDMDLDLETPIATRKPLSMTDKPRSRLSSVASDLYNPETGSRRDTPVPELISHAE